MLTFTSWGNQQVLAAVQGDAPGADTLVHFTADQTTGSPTLANVSSVVGLVVGMQLVAAAGIPAGATIITIGTNTVTMSATATATAVGAFTVAGAAVEPGLLNGCTVMLFQADLTPSENTVLADLTPASYSGYADKTATVWGQPFINPTGEWETVAPVQQFNYGSGAAFCTVFGYGLVVPGTTPLLLAAERFASPVQMTIPGDAVVFVPRLTVPQDLGGVPV